jgi:hypothetical protein
MQPCTTLDCKHRTKKGQCIVCQRKNLLVLTPCQNPACERKSHNDFCSLCRQDNLRKARNPPKPLTNPDNEIIDKLVHLMEVNGYRVDRVNRIAKEIFSDSDAEVILQQPGGDKSI